VVLGVGIEVWEERAEEAQGKSDQCQREQRVEVGATESEPVERPTLGRV
jgi:hypothetical protein